MLQQVQESCASRHMVVLEMVNDRRPKRRTFEATRQSILSSGKGTSWIAFHGRSITLSEKFLSIPISLAPACGKAHHITEEWVAPCSTTCRNEVCISSEAPCRCLCAGSRSENWHSLLQTGVQVLSNTPHMLNGAAYGKGRSPQSTVEIPSSLRLMKISWLTSAPSVRL